MDAGPVAAATAARAPAPSWKLAPAIAAQTQGIVVTGFGDLATGRALFLQFDWPPGQAPKGFLNRLLAVAPVTSATPPNLPNAQSQAASIAFSPTGLRQLGLPAGTLSTFSRPFWEGMFQEDRLRRIGDRREGAWLETVVPGGPVWSANTPSNDPSRTPITTELTVHALLLLYTQSEQAANDWVDLVNTAISGNGVTVVRTLDLMVNVVAGGGFSREHFGFADALSQPLPYGDPTTALPYGDATTHEASAVLMNGQPAAADRVQGVPLGDFLIGYIDGHHDTSPGPVVTVPPGAPAPALPPSAIAEGAFDLGLNGSYLVARELKQSVAGFWQSMAQNAAALGVNSDWLAERVIGRN